MACSARPEASFAASAGYPLPAVARAGLVSSRSPDSQDRIALFPKRAGAASCRAPSIGFINAADRQQCGRAVIVTIFGMIALTVAGAFWLARSGGDKQFVFEASPDGPCPFGCGMAWLAIRSDEPDAVIEALRLENAAPCNWNSGVGAAYDDWLGAAHVFVSPPVRGWTFVVGLPLPHPVGRGFVDKCTPMLVDLGGRFDEVQYFFSYPPIDFYAWARVKDGRLVRAVRCQRRGHRLEQGACQQGRTRAWAQAL